MFELWLCRMPLLQEIHENIKRWLGITSLTNFQIYISEVTQSCPTLCDPVDDSLPGSSIHGIFLARLLEWVAISFSRRSSQSRDRTRVSHIPGRRFNLCATREAGKQLEEQCNSEITTILSVFLLDHLAFYILIYQYKKGVFLMFAFLEHR